MALRIVHPHVDGEATAASLTQFRQVHEPRGWELVPDGTPAPGEIGYQPHRATPVPASNDLVILADPEPEPESTDSAASDEAADEAAPKARKPSRRRAADPDAATTPED